jgi:hypothetical protein
VEWNVLAASIITLFGATDPAWGLAYGLQCTVNSLLIPYTPNAPPTLSVEGRAMENAL